MVTNYVKILSFVLVHFFIIEPLLPFFGVVPEENVVEDLLPSTVVLASMGYGMTDDYGPGPYHPDYQYVINLQKAHFIDLMGDRWHHFSKGQKAIAFSIYMTGIKYAHLGGNRLFYAHRLQRDKSLAEEVVMGRTPEELKKLHTWLQAPTSKEFLARVEPGFLPDMFLIWFREISAMTYEEVQTHIAQLLDCVP